MINPIAHLLNGRHVEVALEDHPAHDLHFVGDGEALLDYLYRRGDFTGLRGRPLPGLILVDMNVPRPDRHATFAAVKADPNLRDIPLVMLTTSRGKADSFRAYRLAGSAFLTRAVPFSALAHLAQNLGGRPVVILSASAPMVGGHRVYNLGGEAYLAKPARALSWLDLVRSLGKYWSFEMVELAPDALAA